MADKETANNGRVGDGTPGPGRPKGVPNRATTAVRDVFSALVEANAERVQALFDQVARKDPAGPGLCSMHGDGLLAFLPFDCRDFTGAETPTAPASLHVSFGGAIPMRQRCKH